MHEIKKKSVVPGIEPTNFGLLDQRRSALGQPSPFVMLESTMILLQL